MSKSKSKVTFGKAMGNGREDGYTEAWILLDGERVGLLTSRFDKTDPCDWYSNASVRCVAVEAEIWGQESGPRTTFEVEVMKSLGWSGGYTRLTTAASARAEAKRMVRDYFAD